MATVWFIHDCQRLALAVGFFYRWLRRSQTLVTALPGSVCTRGACAGLGTVNLHCPRPLGARTFAHRPWCPSGVIFCDRAGCANSCQGPC